MTEREAAAVVRELLLAVAHMHGEGVMHQDLVIPFRMPCDVRLCRDISVFVFCQPSSRSSQAYLRSVCLALPECLCDVSDCVD